MFHVKRLIYKNRRLRCSQLTINALVALNRCLLMKVGYECTSETSSC